MADLDERPLAHAEETVLVERARDGDRAAFEALYRIHTGGIYDFALRLAGRPDDAEDIAQEAFARALGAIGSISRPEAFKSWLFSIAHNTAMSHVRRPAYREARLDVQRADCVGLDVVDPDALADPALAAEAAATRRFVWEVAASLDAEDYTLLDLHLRRDLGGKEIAGIIGISANAVYVRLNRLKKSFERSARALYVLRTSGGCDRLKGQVAGLDSRGFCPEAVSIAAGHVEHCAECKAVALRFTAPLAVFVALGSVTGPGAIAAAAIVAVAAALVALGACRFNGGGIDDKARANDH